MSVKNKFDEEDPPWVDEVEIVYDEDMELTAYYLTLLLTEVNKGINQGSTFEIILQMIAEIADDGGAITDERAKEFGRLVKATENETPANSKKH